MSHGYYSIFFAICKEISEKSKRGAYGMLPYGSCAVTPIHTQYPPDGVPSGGFMIDIGFYISALYKVVSTSPSSMAVVEMTTKPSAVMVIALPAAAIAWAGMT